MKQPPPQLSRDVTSLSVASATDAGGGSPNRADAQKKIGLLTFHRCINYGAYWQARCLSDFFAGLGHQVAVLDYVSPQYFFTEMRHALRPFRPAVRRDVPPLLAKTLKFMRAQQGLRRTRMFSLSAPPAFSEFDLIVIGSDEVWNLSHPWLGGRPLFFGESLAPKRLVAYGASFGNYDASNGLGADWIARLQRFDHISVRDLNSIELVHRHLGREPTLVLDPCLQFPGPVAPADPAASRHLLVYGHAFAPEVVTQARNWAAARKLSVVSIGYRNDWADYSVLSAGPDDFVRAFQAAEAVVTSYLHGCIFSLRYARPFVAQLSRYRANKIEGLLRMVSAEHRIHDPGNPGRIADCLSTPLEPAVLSSIAAHRERSAVFLNSCLQ